MGNNWSLCQYHTSRLPSTPQKQNPREPLVEKPLARTQSEHDCCHARRVKSLLSTAELRRQQTEDTGRQKRIVVPVNMFISDFHSETRRDRQFFSPSRANRAETRDVGQRQINLQQCLDRATLETYGVD